MRRKIHKLQIARAIIQIVLLILLPGLFTLTFSEIGKLYMMIIKGDFKFVQSLSSIIESLAIVPVTIILGRFFCGWMCAFGTVNDFLYMISKKLFKLKFRISEKLDNKLKYVKYIILIFVVVMIWTLGSKSFNTLSPWDTFAQLAQFPPQFVFQYTIGFVALMFIFLGNIFVERFFCRYLCPLGAVFTLVSKVRIFKIDKPSEKCGNCQVCTNNCAMGLQLHTVNKVRSGECINCLKCVEACPQKNAQGSLLNVNMNSALVSSAAIAGILGIYSINSIVNAGINNMGVGNTISNTTYSSSTLLQNKYKDGVYTGTGTGYRPGIEVSVSIKNDKITSIQVTAINDTPSFYSEPVNIVPKEIIQAQSTKVDGVSGATRTSNGIKMAVENALSKSKL